MRRRPARRYRQQREVHGCPASTMNRRLFLLLLRSQQRPHTLDALADALFERLHDIADFRLAASPLRSVFNLAWQAGQDLPLTVKPSNAPGLDALIERQLAFATQLPTTHLAVMRGRQRHLDDTILAHALGIPTTLVDRYYAQAYALIRWMQ